MDRNEDDRTAWRSMAVLFAVTVFSYLDRSLLSLLQVPIKQDLGLSNGQLGALTGLAFGVGPMPVTMLLANTILLPNTSHPRRMADTIRPSTTFDFPKRCYEMRPDPRRSGRRSKLFVRRDIARGLKRLFVDPLEYGFEELVIN